MCAHGWSNSWFKSIISRVMISNVIPTSMLEMSFVSAGCCCSDQSAAAPAVKQTFAKTDCVSAAHACDYADNSGETAVNIATWRIALLLIVTLGARWKRGQRMWHTVFMRGCAMLRKIITEVTSIEANAQHIPKLQQLESRATFCNWRDCTYQKCASL